MTQPTVNGSPSQLAFTTVGANTLTLAHNHAGGNCITIDVEYEDGSARTLNTLTYNGVACTRIASASGTQSLGGVASGLERWYLINPSTGSFNAVATFSGNQLGTMTIQSWNNVDTSSPISAATFSSAGTNTPAPSITLAPTADQVVMAAVMGDNTNAVTPISVSVGTAIGTPQREGVYNDAAGLSAQNSSGNTITFGFTTTNNGYLMGSYLLNGTTAPPPAAPASSQIIG